MQALLNFRRKNIFPSRIAGTSSGSIVGACMPGAKHPKKFCFFKSITFFTGVIFFKKAGLIGLDALRYICFGEAVLGDLKIPTQITATDLVRGRLKIFEPGNKI
jgi:NTE family protein